MEQSCSLLNSKLVSGKLVSDKRVSQLAALYELVNYSLFYGIISLNIDI
jgi:hypothetical protein